MALTIEDGTGVTGADSFATTAELDTICTNYFAHAETGSNAHKEAALRRSFLFMRSLNWSSDYVWPVMDGTIPTDIKNAQCIFAHYEMATEGGLAPTVVAGQQKVLVKAGEIGWQVTGASGVDAQRGVVMMAMDLLADYLVASGVSSILVRS